MGPRHPRVLTPPSSGPWTSHRPFPGRQLAPDGASPTFVRQVRHFTSLSPPTRPRAGPGSPAFGWKPARAHFLSRLRARRTARACALSPVRSRAPDRRPRPAKLRARACALTASRLFFFSRRSRGRGQGRAHAQWSLRALRVTQNQLFVRRLGGPCRLTPVLSTSFPGDPGGGRVSHQGAEIEAFL